MAEVSTWEELITARSDSDVVDWTGGDLDFNEIQPEGFTSTINIYGIIDFHGATFRNFRAKYNRGMIDFYSTKTGGISNLKFLNIKVDIPTDSDSYRFLTVRYGGGGTGYEAPVKNCEFSVYATADKANQAVAFTGLDGDFEACSFRFIGDFENGYMFPFCNGAKLTDSLIIFDIDQNGINETTARYMLNNCLVIGKIVNKTSSNKPLLGNNNSKNNQFLLEGNYKILSGYGKSIYDSTKMTLDSGSTNCFGFDPSNPDMAALRDAGFPCALPETNS